MAEKKRNHEELTGRGPNIVVRQDRFQTQGDLFLETPSGLLEVHNYSAFGFAVRTKKPVNPSDVTETRLLFDGEVVAEMSLTIRRAHESEHGYEYGLETISDIVPIEKLQYLSEVRSALKHIGERHEKTAQLPLEIRCFVQDLASKLEEYEQVAKSFEAKPYANKGERDEALKQVVGYLGRAIFDDIRATNLKLQNILASQDESAMKDALMFFRKKLGSFIYQSPFTHRSFQKPRGYAGDFEMMNQIYRNDNFGHTLFGSCMEYAVQLHEEPNAVRNRSEYLADKIITMANTSQQPLHFLSVACGPAQEVALAVRRLSQEQLSRITFHLLDQDEDALKYAQKNIRNVATELNKTVNTELVNKGIKEVILEGLKHESFDMIYSAGLFDYFSDPVAVRAGRTLSKAIKPKGRMVIGNFNIASPNWFGMLCLFDWHLLLRSETDLKRIFKLDGFSMTVESEAQNINLFCVMNKD